MCAPLTQFERYDCAQLHPSRVTGGFCHQDVCPSRIICESLFSIFVDLSLRLRFTISEHATLPLVSKRLVSRSCAPLAQFAQRNLPKCIPLTRFESTICKVAPHLRTRSSLLLGSSGQTTTWIGSPSPPRNVGKGFAFAAGSANWSEQGGPFQGSGHPRKRGQGGPRRASPDPHGSLR